jgi:hypothetical protein
VLKVAKRFPGAGWLVRLYVAAGLAVPIRVAAEAPPPPPSAVAGPVVVSGDVTSRTLGVAPNASATTPSRRGIAAPPRVESRQVVLISDGTDPALVATLRRTLEQLGATVVVVPASSVLPAFSAASAGSPVAAPFGASAPRSAVAWDGQLRFRYETRTVLDYRLPGTFGRDASQALGESGDVSLLRTRVGASVRFAPGVHGYVRLQDARTTSAGAAPGGPLANADVHDAWVDLDSLGGGPVSARIGRQPLDYGEGRVLARSEWGNAGRAYDGARVRWTPRTFQADGFLAWVHEDRSTGSDRVLTGLDVLWRRPGGLEAEGYHFERAFRDMACTSESGHAGGLFDATTGLRARALRGPLELRVEGAVQRGRRAGDEVGAWFGVVRLAAGLNSAWRTRISLEHLLASGDPSPTDGRFQRFDPVGWSGHGFQGAVDVAGAANLSDWCAGLALQPAPAWTIQSELHAFSLASATDAWADDSGTLLRRDPAGSAGTALGREADASVRWEARPGVSVTGGASRFMAGPFVRATGGGGDTAWGFLQLAIAF